jgi:hypothetical protein
MTADSKRSPPLTGRFRGQIFGNSHLKESQSFAMLILSSKIIALTHVTQNEAQTDPLRGIPTPIDGE